MSAELRWITTEEEKAAVFRLRYELYVEGQGLFLDEADHERRWLVDEKDADGHIAVAEIDGRLVGTIRLNWGGDAGFCEQTRRYYEIDHFSDVVAERDVVIVTRLVVLPEYRGTDLGFRLFQKVFEFAAAHGADLILGKCEIHLVSHYHALGFRPFGKLYNHPTNGVLVPIAAVTTDFETLRAIESPMLPVLRRRAEPVRHLQQILTCLAEEPAIISREQDEATYWKAVRAGCEAAHREESGLFAELSREELAQILARSHVLRCSCGDALARRGHASRTLYILLSGSLEIRDRGVVTHISERGAVVGEIAMLSAGPRVNDIVVGSRGARVLALSDGSSPIRAPWRPNSCISSPGDCARGWWLARASYGPDGGSRAVLWRSRSASASSDRSNR